MKKMWSSSDKSNAWQCCQEMTIGLEEIREDGEDLGTYKYLIVVSIFL